MFLFESVWVLFAIFLSSLFWAGTGHLLWLFYSFLWRSGISLLGVGKKEPVVVATPGADEGLFGRLTTVLARQGLRLVGVLGAFLALWGFFWLLGDLVADQALQRRIQLAALMVLTLALLVAGYRIRVASEDLLGTGLLCLGFWMIPIDAWFYEVYILGYSTRSAWQLFGALSVLGAFLVNRTGSRTFGWMTPPCLLASILLMGDKFRWPVEQLAWVASVIGPGFLAMARWTGTDPASRAHRCTSSLLVCAMVSPVIALGALASSSPEVAPWLPLAVAVAGSGTVAAVAYLVSDLRGLLLLVPYHVFLFQEVFHRYSVDYGSLGLLAAALGLALLALERTRRRGAERRRGLDPWCSVPALTLLLAAVVGDGTMLALLVSRIAGLRIPDVAGLAPEAMGGAWAEIQRGVFYLSRLDPALDRLAVSGLLAASGIAYLGGQVPIPLFCYGAGIPLVTGLVSLVARLRPAEIWFESYAGYFGCLTLVLVASGLALRSGSLRWAAQGLAAAAHLLAPPTYLLAGVRIWRPEAPPEWYLQLVPVVMGFQCLFHARATGRYPNLGRIGAVLAAFPWPFVILALSYREAPGMLPWLVTGGLVIGGCLLFDGLHRSDLGVAVAGGLGLAGTVLAAAIRVGQGEVMAKLVVVVFGLVLLWAGSRSRKETGALVCLLALAGVAGGEPVRRRLDRERVEALGAANPDDPMIRVVLAASGWTVPPEASGEVLGRRLQEHLSALSGIASAAAALQLVATPLRLEVPARARASDRLGWQRDVAPRSLDFTGLARRLPGSPVLPPRAGDRLEDVPADLFHLRFEGAASLARILAFYRERGRTILAVTAPGLALPDPGTAFARATGVGLVEAAAGCRRGALVFGDPALGLAPDLVVVLEFPDEAAAGKAHSGLSGRVGAGLLKRDRELLVIGTVASRVARIADFVGRPPSGEALSHEPDFRYASLLPLPGPDGRLFVSEAVVRRLISYRSWVATNRRLDCLAELADLEAAIAFGRSSGRPLPEEAGKARTEALHRKWIRDVVPCRSGGTLGSSPEGLPRCSLHGDRRKPEPLDDAAIEGVYPEEAQGYRNFQWRYQSLYSTWIDPISVGITAGERRVELRTAILPVARLPFYRSLRAVSEEQPVASGTLGLPPGTDQAMAAVAVRLPTDRHPAWRSWSGMFRRYYWREPALWKLDSALEPNPFGEAAGFVLMPGDPGFLASPDRLWKDETPPPVAAWREVSDPARAGAYLETLVGGRGHRTLAGGGTAYGFRVFGRRWLHAAVGNRGVVLATAPERLETLVAAAPSSGVLPDGSAWARIRPARLWEAGGNYRSLAGGLLGPQCRKLRASVQNLIDLGLPWPAGPVAWPQGEPFLAPDAACPAGGRLETRAGTIACTLHGVTRAETEASPVPGSPLDRMITSFDSLELEISAQADAIWTRVVFE